MSSIFDMQFSRCKRYLPVPGLFKATRTKDLSFARIALKKHSCCGSHLLSHTVASIVPSAAYVLTIVFGMGTGVYHKRIATATSSLLPLSN